MNNSDIVIIGAGPAGSMTSLFLSKYKIPHTIIDKAIFPRDKICGDGISGKSVKVFKTLDPDILNTFALEKDKFIGSMGVKFVAPNGKELDIPFRLHMDETEHALAYVSKRYDFDYELYRRISSEYATIYSGTEVTGIDKDQTGFTIQMKNGAGKQMINQAKLIVGAEGDRSIVAKKFANIRKENKHYCAGVRAYYSGVSGMHPQNFMELHFLPELLPGYLWIFPLPNGLANVGMGMLSSDVSRLKSNLKTDLIHAINTNPNLKVRFKDATIQGKISGWGLPLASKKRKLSGDGFLLTGDAASLIDPFSGEGIGNALYSGMLAANQIRECVQFNRFDAEFLKSYDHNFYTSQWDELSLSYKLQKLCRYPSLFNLVVNKALKSKTIRETVITMFDDVDLRSKLRNPLFYFRLLFNK